MKQGIQIAIAMIAAIILIACGGNNNDGRQIEIPQETRNIVEIASADDRFTTLVDLVVAAGLAETLSAEDANLTVLAPTNDAFAKLPQATLDALAADADMLSAVLQYHVIAGALDSGDVAAASGTKVSSLAGPELAVSITGPSIFVNLSKVIVADVEGTNGVIHAIDTVLLPPSMMDAPDDNIVEVATAAGSFTTLLAALDAASLTDTIATTDGLTVFAPTDAAFGLVGERLLDAIIADVPVLTAILQQHVIAGEVDALTAFTLNGSDAGTLGADVAILIEDRDAGAVLKVGGATVTMTDIKASNGIIHVIDAVIVGEVALPAPVMSITDIVKADPDNFSTLLAALEATDLDMTLDNIDDTYTVFAPTNAAFDKLPEGALDGLLADTDALENILLYHVNASQILAADAVALAGMDSKLLDMANMSQTAVTLSGDDLYINLSQVTAPNVMAENGVIHVIDTVLIPAADAPAAADRLSVSAVVSGDARFSTLLTAITTAGIDIDALASGDSGPLTIFAPTNAAFAKIPEADLAAILADTAMLTDILQQHIVAGAEVNSLTAFTLNGAEPATVGGKLINIDIVGGALVAEGATVEQVDIYASNAVIHAIDTVITTAEAPAMAP